MVLAQIICFLAVCVVAIWAICDNYRLSKTLKRISKEYKVQYELYIRRYKAYSEALDNQLDMVKSLSEEIDKLKKEKAEYVSKYGNAMAQITRLKKKQK